MAGLVEPEKLKPGELVGVNKDSFLILDTLPAEYDSRVKAMEVEEKPTEDYNDVGGLDKQIEEMVEAIVLPMTHRDRFVNLGIKPPKGCLMYGPPGMLFLAVPNYMELLYPITVIPCHMPALIQTLFIP
jgi:26S proteasome regulatory subunit T5